MHSTYIKSIKFDNLQMQQHAFYASKRVDVVFFGASTAVDFIEKKVNVEHSDTQNEKLNQLENHEYAFS